MAQFKAKRSHSTGLPRVQSVSGSPLSPGAEKTDLPRYFALTERRPNAPGNTTERPEDRVARIIAAMDEWGRWKGELGTTSHPFKADGSREVAPGDFSRTQVGDDSDTSPYRAQGVIGISTSVYIRNMSELIRYLEGK